MNFEFLWFVNGNVNDLSELNIDNIDILFLRAYFVLEKYMWIEPRYKAIIKRFDPSKVVFLLTDPMRYNFEIERPYGILLKQLRTINVVPENSTYHYKDYNFINSDNIDQIATLSELWKTNIVMSSLGFPEKTIKELLDKTDNTITLIVKPKTVHNSRRIFSNYGIEIVEEIVRKSRLDRHIQIIDKKVTMA